MTASYDPAEKYTKEAVFFIEQVTGHVIPDVRRLLKKGASAVQAEITEKQAQTEDIQKKEYYEAMKITLDALLALANRYQTMAEEKAKTAEGKEKERFAYMAEVLRKGCRLRVPGTYMKRFNPSY